jgi:hypothetical protein
MNISKEGKKAEESKKYRNEGEKTLGADPQAPFPLFPFGAFLLPLFIPVPARTEQKKK